MIDLQTGLPRPGTAARPGRANPQSWLQSMLVDQIDCGLLVCDADAGLHYVNRAAAEELSAERLLRRCGDTLRCTGTTSSALDSALRAAANKGRRQLLTLQHRGDRLMASLVPLPRDSGEVPLVLIVLGRRGPCSALSLELLSSAYGLTLAERRVLAALIGNAQPREIAATHGVALSTVRTQVASVRAKFGVHTIEALLVLAAEVPPVRPVLRGVDGDGWRRPEPLAA